MLEHQLVLFQCWALSKKVKLSLIILQMGVICSIAVVLFMGRWVHIIGLQGVDLYAPRMLICGLISRQIERVLIIV